MRLPWGNFSLIQRLFLRDTNCAIVGCLSFEERCCQVPELLSETHRAAVELIEIRDPRDAMPDFSAETRSYVETNRARLRAKRISFTHIEAELLASEDEIIRIADGLKAPATADLVIFDVTSFPKRYFGFMLKRMLLSSAYRNVIITYTQAGSEGYATGHLAEDSMTCDHLPGFAPPIRPASVEFTLAVSVGFEPLNIRSVLETYREKHMKLILPFPPNGESTRRVWATLRNLAKGDPDEVPTDSIEVVAAWDAECVYNVLGNWISSADGLNLAPFGPKPHSLGMFLFATERDCGMFYTQPKAYNPGYTRGAGKTWAYVVKWDGVPCYQRQSQPV